MPKDIFIGVDGGGTKTRMHVEDAEGNLIGDALGGPAQIRVSPDQAWDSINDTLAGIFQKAQIELSDKQYAFHIGCALAGTEFQQSCDDFLAKKHPFDTLILRSDGYAACLGAHDGAEGAIIIIGTGVKGFQIENNECAEVGGWGFPQGDEGSGAWLGLQAVRYTLHGLDGRLSHTPLFDAILARFNNNLDNLLNWSIGATSTMYATLAPIVTEYVIKQDPIALRIIKTGAQAVDDVGRALEVCTRNKQRALPCSLFGGIAPSIEPWLSPTLRQRIVPRKYGAGKGAIIMIRKELESKH